MLSVIVCNKDQNTYRVTHFRWWLSLPGWTTNKEDTTDDVVHNSILFNSRDQNKDIGVLGGNINAEFSRFFYFASVFLLEKIRYNHLLIMIDMFSIQTCSIRYKYQSCSTGIRYKPHTGIKPYCVTL